MPLWTPWWDGEGEMVVGEGGIERLWVIWLRCPGLDSRQRLIEVGASPRISWLRRRTKGRSALREWVPREDGDDRGRWRAGMPRARWWVSAWSKSGLALETQGFAAGLKVAWRSGMGCYGRTEMIVVDGEPGCPGLVGGFRRGASRGSPSNLLASRLGLKVARRSGKGLLAGEVGWAFFDEGVVALHAVLGVEDG